MDVTSTTNLGSNAAASHSENVYLGCGLSIGGNLLISVSLNVQKYSHNTAAASNSSKHYTKRPLWWFGMCLMVLGEVGNFSAFGFAPASMVAPLGTVTVLANMVIAVVFLKEKLRLTDILGSLLAICGAIMLVTFSAKKETILDAAELVQYLKEIPFIIFGSIEIAAIVFLLVLLYKFNTRFIVQLLLLCAFFASFTVISAKAVSGMLNLSVSGDLQLQYPIFWIMLIVMVVTAIAQVKYLNQAMMSFNATTVVPTHFCFFTISAILSGVVFYKEFYGLAVTDVVLFLFGCLLCFVGVYLITRGRAGVLPQAAAIEQEKLLVKEGYKATHRVNIFPYGLRLSLSRSEVQPRAELLTGHHIERKPILSRGHSSSSESEGDEYDPAHHRRPPIHVHGMYDEIGK